MSTSNPSVNALKLKLLAKHLAIHDIFKTRSLPLRGKNVKRDNLDSYIDSFDFGSSGIDSFVAEVC